MVDQSVVTLITGAEHRLLLPSVRRRGSEVDSSPQAAAPCSAKQLCPLAVETGSAYYPGGK